VVGTQNTEKAKAREITLKYIHFAEVVSDHTYMYTSPVAIQIPSFLICMDFMNTCCKVYYTCVWKTYRVRGRECVREYSCGAH
jgi:hypothetical protein